jgi:hypothetical protein
MELVKISKVKPNETNPRFIKDSKFKKLVKSIKEFPEMLKLRPIVVNKDMVVLGGNMRLKACKEAGLKDVWILKADNLTEEQQKEFIVKDNVGFGEWDWDILANDWDIKELEDWGLDGFPFDIDADEKNEDDYSKKIEVPKYEPKGEKPETVELFDKEKADDFIEKIKASGISKEEKAFLFMAAYRHTKFNYKNIAEYYAHANKEMQGLMEDSALVIIDFDKAIENGYVKLSEDIANQYKTEHND